MILLTALALAACSPGFEADGVWVTNKCGVRENVNLRNPSEIDAPVLVGHYLELEDGERGEYTRTTLTGSRVLLEILDLTDFPAKQLEEIIDLSQFDIVVDDAGVRRYDLVLEGELCP